MQSSAPRKEAARQTIAPRQYTDKPTRLADVNAYVDSIEMFMRRRPTIKLKNALRLTTGRRVWDDPIKDFGYRLIVDKPSIESVPILEQRYEEGGASVFRVHIAFDYDPIAGAVETVVDILRRKTHLKYQRASDRQIHIESSAYAIKTEGRHTRVTKQKINYLSPFGLLDGEVDKIHDEVRLEKKRAVVAAGITRPIDLLTLNPRTFLLQHLKFADYEPAMRKIVAKAIRNTHAHCANPHVDLNIRVPSIMRRVGVIADTLTDFMRIYPVRSERLKPLAVFHVFDELQWVRAGLDPETGVIRAREKCGELMPLLHAAPNPDQMKTVKARVRLTDEERRRPQLRTNHDHK